MVVGGGGTLLWNYCWHVCWPHSYRVLCCFVAAVFAVVSKKESKMTRIQDLGELYDKAIQVVDKCLGIESDLESVNAAATRASTAMRVIDQYLNETRQ